LSLIFKAQITFVESDVDGDSTNIPNSNNSFDCFNELIKDFQHSRVARLHPNSGNSDCILKKTDTITSNKQQDAQYGILSGD
jgi:hypothetical protein